MEEEFRDGRRDGKIVRMCNACVPTTHSEDILRVLKTGTNKDF